MPKVSVIMPAYNHEKYIAEAIKSVLDQTYADLELVIVDDCSTDATVDEIKRFTDPRIKFFRFGANQGLSTAKQKCIDMSKGRYISSFCSDDIFMPDKLKKQVDYLEGHPKIGAVLSYAKIIDENGGDFTDKEHFYCSIFYQDNRSRHQWLNRFFYKGCCLCMPSSMIRRECISREGIYDKRFTQLADMEFWIKLFMKYEIFIIPEELVKFRLRAGESNLSGHRPESRMRSVWEEAKVLRNYLAINNIEDLLKVFPEVNEPGFVRDRDLISFFIAKLALKRDHIPHHVFALDTLYGILSSRKMAKKLKEKCNFSYTDFIKLTGKVDAFNVIRADNLFGELKELKEEKGGQHVT